MKLILIIMMTTMLSLSMVGAIQQPIVRITTENTDLYNDILYVDNVTLPYSSIYLITWTYYLHDIQKSAK